MCFLYRVKYIFPELATSLHVTMQKFEVDISMPCDFDIGVSDTY